MSDSMNLLDCTASMVVYNNPPEMIRNAVMSFLNSERTVKLYIIDNSQSPILKPALDGLFISYHFNGENVGYGRGHNWAIKQAANSRYHLILNPDITIPIGAVSSLIAFMDDNPQIGLVCPKILNEDGSIQYLNKRYTTVLDLFLRRFLPGPLKPFFQKRLDYYEMRDVGYDTSYDVPFLTGCFMFCRTSVLKEIGGFDPRYFLHFEDADLTRKFQEHNTRTVYYPNVLVTHLWERAPHKSLKMALLLIVNGIRYFNKWGWKFW
jgi:GT2 family glycosyltransferase